MRAFIARSSKANCGKRNHRAFRFASNVISRIRPEKYFTTPYNAQVVSSGEDITIVAVSITLINALEAKAELKKYGIRPEIIDLRWIRPLDIDLIVQSVKKTGRLLVVDTGWKMFGVAGEVIASVCEQVSGLLRCSPRRITIPDIPCPASAFLEPYYQLIFLIIFLEKLITKNRY